MIKEDFLLYIILLNIYIYCCSIFTCQQMNTDWNRWKGVPLWITTLADWQWRVVDFLHFCAIILTVFHELTESHFNYCNNRNCPPTQYSLTICCADNSVWINNPLQHYFLAFCTFFPSKAQDSTSITDVWGKTARGHANRGGRQGLPQAAEVTAGKFGFLFCFLL